MRNTLALELIQHISKGYSIVAEIPAKTPNHRSWIQILPWADNGEKGICVRLYELPTEMVENEWDDYTNEQLNAQRKDVQTLGEALAIADEWLDGPVEWVRWADSDAIV